MLEPSDFLGAWCVSRVIDDRLAGQGGRFEGAAAFAPEEGGLRYGEEGLLTLASGASLRASRGYLWRWDPDGVAVRFADGRPFHSFHPEGARAGTDHPCGDDLYRVRYDFTRWTSWQVAWDVTGPRKAYAMTTAYARP